MKARTNALTLAALAMGSVSLGASQAQAQAFAPAALASSEACQRLASLAGPDARIDTVEYIAAGPMKAPFPGMPPIALPAHCRLVATLHPRKGVGGQTFGIGFELRLPANWNGRFLFQGGGGLDGAIRPALGLGGGAKGPALSQGFAVVSTDAGHEGPDASFAADQQARIDYAYAALGEVGGRAKGITAAFYGAAPKYAYFDGCSNGGRQSMMAAERFPGLFDGIVAGDPGFRLSRAAVGEAWNTVQYAKVAQRDSAGRPIVSTALTNGELRLVADRILADCDRLDGLADGSVNNWKSCRFDIGEVRCKTPKASGCLPQEKVDALRKTFAAARDSRGQPLYAAWPWDPGIAGRDWRGWRLGDSPKAPGNGLNETMGADALARYFSTPPYTGPFDVTKFDFDQAAARVAETGAINDATATFLTTFAQRGGKLIIYHGLADPVFSALDTVAWYDDLQATMGPTQGWGRLFLVPGMNHCSGGPATDRFDALGAVQAWVENGVAPDQIIASGSLAAGAPPVERPLCPYPEYAAYADGPVGSASSFRCRRDDKSAKVKG